MDEKATPRTRGAQPGNTNALKHGFYSRRFRNLEADDLDVALLDGLQDEIALIRVVIRRVFERASEEELDLDQLTRSLAVLGRASTQLANLLRTQKIISGADESLFTSALREALKDGHPELGLD
jgi:hypothetical protein